uniref:Uncharacterized protein n=1 Tax=Picocystis salinarum TaxID=88271 RepID=A0A6U9Q6Q5_9CHLO
MAEEQGSFVRCLAHSTDPEQRKRGLEALAAWMKQRKVVTELDMLKIWKALFYCVWHCDKKGPQEQLTEELANMMGTMAAENAHLYFFAFVSVVRKEWARVDKHRLDKFLALTRAMVRECFQWMRAKKWKEEIWHRHTQSLLTNCLVPDDEFPAVGFSLHICDVYLKELAKIEPNIKVDLLTGLLEPFVMALATSNRPALRDRIQCWIFEPLLGQSPIFQLKSRELHIVGEMLFVVAADENTRSKNRAKLYEIHGLIEKVVKEREGEEGKPIDTASNEGNPNLQEKAVGKNSRKRKGERSEHKRSMPLPKSTGPSPPLTRSAKKKKTAQAPSTPTAQMALVVQAKPSSGLQTPKTPRTPKMPKNVLSLEDNVSVELPGTTPGSSESKPVKNSSEGQDPATPKSTPSTRHLSSRVRFSLEKNMIKLFRKDTLPSTPSVLSPLQSKGVLKKSPAKGKQGKQDHHGKAGFAEEVTSQRKTGEARSPWEGWICCEESYFKGTQIKDKGTSAELISTPGLV